MIDSEDMMKYLKDLKDRETPIRIHGNGFIQIDVAKNARIHIWSPRIPHQLIYTGIHDHRFDFFSTVLWGDGLHHKIFLPLSEPEHAIGLSYDMYVAVERQGEDTLLVPANKVVYDRNYWKVTEDIYPGHSYRFKKGIFHETLPIQINEDGELGCAITYMVKTDSDKKYRPRVLCPSEFVPDNEFNRLQFSVGHCWAIAFEIVQSWKG